MSQPAASTAVDAVRCLYLARVLRRRGHLEAAGRWEEMAASWMNSSGSSQGDTPSNEPQGAD